MPKKAKAKAEDAGPKQKVENLSPQEREERTERRLKDSLTGTGLRDWVFNAAPLILDSRDIVEPESPALQELLGAIKDVAHSLNDDDWNRFGELVCDRVHVQDYEVHTGFFSKLEPTWRQLLTSPKGGSTCVFLHMGTVAMTDPLLECLTKLGWFGICLGPQKPPGGFDQYIQYIDIHCPPLQRPHRSMNTTPNALASMCGSGKMRRGDVSHQWSDMSASTCASSASGSSCTSDTGDSFCLHCPANHGPEMASGSGSVPPLQFADFCACIEVKNSFLQFPLELLNLEISPTRRRSKSAPCRGSVGHSAGARRGYDSATGLTSAGRTVAGSDSSRSKVTIRSGIPSTTMPPLPPTAGLPLRLDDLLWTLAPAQPLESWWPVPLTAMEVAAEAALDSCSPAVSLAGVYDHLADADEAEQGNVESMVSQGSAKHYLGQCQPCAFVRKQGCTNGANCKFCHICGPEVRRRRQLDRLDQKRREYRMKKKTEAQAKNV